MLILDAYDFFREQSTAAQSTAAPVLWQHLTVPWVIVEVASDRPMKSVNNHLHYFLQVVFALLVVWNSKPSWPFFHLHWRRVLDRGRHLPVFEVYQLPYKTVKEVLKQQLDNLFFWEDKYRNEKERRGEEGANTVIKDKW